MDKLYENAKKELHKIEENGISTNNIGSAEMLTCIMKNLLKIEKMEDEQMYDRYEARRGGRYESYDNRYGRMNDMGRGSGRYGHRDYDRIYDKVYRVEDGIDNYLYGKDRYYDGDHSGSMTEGLEKTMYAVCTLVETLMDNAETPEEKEIIRKHAKKIAEI